jgi:hypothetical protein
MGKQGAWWRGSAWLVGVLVPIVAVSGCATTADTTSDRPTATVTVTEPAGGPSDDAPVGPDAQVVEIDEYGISFELPAGWTTLDAAKILDSSDPDVPADPVIREFASRMGMTPKKFVRTMASSVLTFSVTDGGAVDGFMDNVNSVGTPQADVNDEQIKYELAAIGAEPEGFEHASTPAGETTRVPYTLAVGGMTIHGVGVYVDVGDAVAAITVSSHSPVKAKELGDQIEGSLRSIG